MSFKDLRKQNTLENLKKEVDKLSSKSKKSFAPDPRFWYPARDDAGNAFCEIRFLPAPPNEDSAFVKIYSRRFDGVNGWYNENDLSTIGQTDPVFEYTQTLYKGSESDKAKAKGLGRKTTYIANILVIKDKLNPENEGKVFLFKYGKTIADKIEAMMNPADEDEPVVNVFHFWDDGEYDEDGNERKLRGGANFKLNVTKKGEFANYDTSVFKAPSSLFGGNDEKLEELWKTQYSLEEFISPSQFKSYDELKAKMVRVLGLDGGPQTNSKAMEKFEDDEVDRIVNKAREEDVDAEFEKRFGGNDRIDNSDDSSDKDDSPFDDDFFANLTKD